MRKTSIRMVALVLGMLMGVQIFGLPERTANGEEEEYVQKVTQVITTTVEMDVLRPTITLPATVKAASEVQIVSKIGGEVTAVYIQEGSIVSANQILIEIEQDGSSSQLVNQYEQTLITLSSSESNLVNLQVLLAEEITQMYITIADLKDSLAYARDNQGLTDASIDSQIEVYEAQVTSAFTSWELAKITLENAKEQMDQSIVNTKEQALSVAISGLDYADSALKDIDDFLGIDRENFDPTYVDHLDTSSNHSYVDRAEQAYKKARDLHDEAVTSVDAATNDSALEALDTAEEALDYTLEALDRMEELLDREIPGSLFLEIYEAFKTTYDGHQTIMNGQLLSVQSARQAIETAELSSDTTIEEAEAGV
ncbi:MAG: hypothetical protein Q8P27_01865, partial [Candidatus Peregrinibacteria bacterium]|nr:hypothetical protein [Candidatus Peregrinibacteria bacterium]